VCDLLQQRIVDVAIDPLTIVQCERCRESKACEIRSRVDIVLSSIAVDDHLFDALRALVVDDGHVALYRWSVESGGCGLASGLAAFVPRRGADCEAFTRAHY
jgi:hypothetical protein